MHIIDHRLKEREKLNNPIKVGVIGAGEMGKGFINQVCRYTPGMTVSAVYNRTIDKAEAALRIGGIQETVYTNNVYEISAAINQNKTVVTNEIDAILECDELDVLVELTGQIKFALEVILKAFEKGRHVVTFNAELEATFGPLLKAEAAKNGVLYTLGFGDQPGVTQNMIRHVNLMGFEPLLCGNIKGLQDHYRTPSTQRQWAELWGMSAKMATNFADGTKISFEQAATANANGFSVAKRGMIGPHYNGHIDDMTSGFYPEVDELRAMGGIVDYVVGAKPGPGVFLLATTDDPLAIKYLDYGKQGKGPLYTFYLPYHLLFFEIAFSVARLIDYRDITLDAESGMKVEVVSVAKTDIEPGEEIDGIGGYKVYGICDNSNAARNENLLPIGLSEGCIVKNKLKKDDLITLNDVEFKDKTLLEAYLQQITEVVPG